MFKPHIEVKKKLAGGYGRDRCVLKLRVCDYPNPKRQRGIAILLSASVSKNPSLTLRVVISPTVCARLFNCPAETRNVKTGVLASWGSLRPDEAGVEAESFTSLRLVHHDSKWQLVQAEKLSNGGEDWFCRSVRAGGRQSGETCCRCRRVPKSLPVTPSCCRF